MVQQRNLQKTTLMTMTSRAAKAARTFVTLPPAMLMLYQDSSNQSVLTLMW
jgi:hypothetical protein